MAECCKGLAPESECECAKPRIAELEARLRPGVSDMLNRLLAADLAEEHPVTGEIRFTNEGEAVIRSRTRRPAVR